MMTRADIAAKLRKRQQEIFNKTSNDSQRTALAILIKRTGDSKNEHDQK